jgi:uncharacterized protein (TIGR01777 family)
LNGEFPAYFWNYETDEIDANAFENVNYVLHLAGANVAGQGWTKKYKQEIVDSRVKTTALLERAIRENNVCLDGFIAASATGCYGNTGDAIADEGTEIGNSFLANVCRMWENSASQLADLPIRVVCVRIGIVLSTQGGALQKLLPSYRLGIGSYFGDGKMHVSWIHLDDLCRFFIEAMENSNYQGTYNAVAPTPTTSKELGRAVAVAVGKPNSLLISAPAFALRLGMGEMAEILLSSSRILPKRTAAAGFEWHYPDLVSAITDLLRSRI